MKRKLIVALLIVVMLASMVPVSAATIQQINTADAMNDMGLFLGTGKGYELDNTLTRAQGVTMLVRMIGKEAEAQSGVFGDPFKDVPTWAKGYVGYAWANKITNGTGPDKFSPDATMTDYMFLTLTLRALGYDDAAGDFKWDNPYALAKKVGLITSTAKDTRFTRGEAVVVFWNALNAPLKGKTTTLADTLIQQDVLEKDDFSNAGDVQENGREENAGLPINPETGKPVEGSKPEVGDQTEKPEEEKPSDGSSESNPDTITYEKYLAMTPAQQQAYFATYADPLAFFAWLDQAKAEYDANQNEIEIGSGGSIDLGDLIGGNG